MKNQNVINKTGYLSGSGTEDNDYNIIPQNKKGDYITMKGVKKNLIAVKLDKDGKPIGMEFMKPGKDYKSGGAYAVLEMPQYQRGGQQFGFDPNDPENQFGFDPNDPLNENFGFNFPPATYGMVNPNQIPAVETGPVAGTGQVQVGDITQPVQESSVVSGIDKSLQSPTAQEMSSFSPEALEIDNFDRTKFFNPYGGIDIPTAATVLGQSIKNKDTLGIVSSAAKLTAGVGRNLVSGLGEANRTNLTMQEYFEELSKTRPAQSLQAGGALNEADYQNIVDTSGIMFTEDSMDALFSSNTPSNAIAPNTPFDLGKYNDVGYYNVENTGNEFLISPTNQNFRNNADIKRSIEYIQGLNPGASIKPNYLSQDQRPEHIKNPYLPEFKKGGQMTDEEFMTGEYLKGIDEDNKHFDKANAKVERGEYLQTKEGDIAEVVGDLHTGPRGGEPIVMDSGDRVLTDDTKLGAVNAKKIRKDYDIEVKAKHTYADVLDKFRNKSGMRKLIKEEEDILAKLEDQKELEDSVTRDLNNKFLHGKLTEITDKKSPLEEARKMLYSKLYEMQEMDKPKDERSAEFQDGGEFTGVESLTGIGEAIPVVPEGQSVGDLGFFGGIGVSQFEQTKIKNPWFDWTDFNPANPEDVKRFQSEYNKLSPRGTNVQVDGAFGQQTQSIYIPWLNKENVKPGDVTQAESERLREESEKGLTENEQILQTLLLPDQYPRVPEGTQPVLKGQRRYDRVDAPQIDPLPYLQSIDNDVQAALEQLEGLSPNVKLAQEANIRANATKAKNDAMLKIDAVNIQKKSEAEIINARLQGRETDAGLMDLLSFEQRQLTAKAKTDYQLEEYFDKIQDVNIGNFQQIEALKNLNERYDKVSFTGTGYDVADAPNFMNSLNATQLSQLQTILEEHEKKTKK